MLVDNWKVESPNVQYTEETITSTYDYQSTKLERGADGKEWVVRPQSTKYEFRVNRKVPKLGVMLVGLGGNNGTTLVAGILANKQ